MSINLTPEIYISWIPRGNVLVKPEIYASIIIAPHIENISADTSRKIKNVEAQVADTLRQIGAAETVQADSYRQVNKIEKISADSSRRVAITEKFSADTFRQVNFAEKILADLRRKISNVEKIFADTLREVEDSSLPDEIVADTLIRNAINEKISAKTLREIVFAEIANADTFRKVNFAEKIVGDSFRQVGAGEKISADSSRVISNVENILADTLREVQEGLQTVIADTQRNLFEFVIADTFREVVKAEKIFGDTEIKIPHKLIYTINAPLRKKLKSAAQVATLQETFSEYKLTSLAITLQEKTLSDTYQLTTAIPMNINDAVTGKFLDYEFKFLVEETNQQDLLQSVRGMYSQDKLLYTRIKNATSKIEYVRKKKNTGYTHTTSTTTYYSASAILASLADYLDLDISNKFDDFIPYNVEPDTNTTYNSYLASLFGWTSRVPQRQINVFIRGGMLYAIQRGKEETVFDISDLPHSRPTINKKLLRTMWQSSDYEKTIELDDDEDPVEEYEYEDIIRPFSGTISYNADGAFHSLTYSNGLLTKEYQSVSNDKQKNNSTTYYYYQEVLPEDKTELEIFMQKIVGDFYLISKTTRSYTYQYGDEETVTVTSPSGDTATRSYNKDKKIYQTITTNYHYRGTSADDIYLYQEHEREKKETYELSPIGGYAQGNTVTVNIDWTLRNKENNLRQTFHEPIGNGWYGQSVYVNGEAQGSNISQGKPGNKVTQYTIQEVQKKLAGYSITVKNNNKEKPEETKDYEEQYKEWRRQLAPMTDITFPVREFAMLYTLTAALKKLNRSVREEVSVEVIDNIKQGVPTLQHVIDFTERIKLDDKEYFLVSNNISFTPKKFIQKLNLVRWNFQGEN